MRLATGGGACVTRVQGVPGWRVICWQFGGGHRFSQRSWQPWRPSRVRSRPPAPSWCARVPASSPESRPAAASRSPRPLPAWPASRAAAVSPPTGTSTITAVRSCTGSAPYLIFWDPNNEITSAEKTLLESYFADSSHDSGASPPTCSASTGSSPTARASPTSSMSWLLVARSITDTDAYPTTGNCSMRTTASSRPRACSMARSRRRSSTSGHDGDALPTGLTGNAPIYEVVTPPVTSTSCFSDDTTCADSVFCAYHSSFTGGGRTIL